MSLAVGIEVVSRGAALGGAAVGALGGLRETSLRSPVKEKDPEPEDVVSIGNSEKSEEKPETDNIFKLKDFAAQHKKPTVNVNAMGMSMEMIKLGGSRSGTAARNQ